MKHLLILLLLTAASISKADLKSAVANAELRKIDAEKQARQQATENHNNAVLYRCVAKALRAKSEEIYSQEKAFREESGLNLILDALRQYEDRHPEKGEFWVFNRFWEMNRVPSSKEKVRSALVEVGMFDKGDTVAMEDLSQVLAQLRQIMKQETQASICANVYTNYWIDLSASSSTHSGKSRTCKSLNRITAPCKSSKYEVDTVFHLERRDFQNL